MSKINYYSIHDIVNIVSNVKLPYIDFFKVKKKPSRIDFIFMEKDNFSLPKPKQWIGNTSFGGPNFIAKDLKWNIKILAKDLLSRPVVYFTKNARRIFKHRSMPLDMLFRSILLTIFLRKGWTFLHSSSLADKEGNVISLSGWMETGKTTSVNTLLKEGYTYVSDDRTLVNAKGEVLIFPTSLKIHRKWVPSIFHSFLDTAKEVKYVPSSLTNLKLKKFILLDRKLESKIINESIDSAFLKILLNYDYEEQINDHNLMKQYAYLNPDLDFKKIRLIQEKLTRDALKNVEIYTIEANGRDFLPGIRKVI